MLLQCVKLARVQLEEEEQGPINEHTSPLLLKPSLLFRLLLLQIFHLHLTYRHATIHLPGWRLYGSSNTSLCVVVF